MNHKRITRAALLVAAVLALPSGALSQSSVAIKRGAAGGIPAWQPGVTLPFATNNGLVCDRTTGANFNCLTTGGPLRGDLIENFNGEPIAPGQNFSTPVCGATLACEQDSDPEKVILEVADAVTAQTAEELYSKQGVFSTVHPPHVYRYMINDYDLDTTAAVLIHQAETGNLTKESVSAGGQAEACERADWDCPQVDFVCWHTLTSAGLDDADGVPAGSTPDIYMYVNGSDSGTKLATIPTGTSRGCERIVPSYGWQEDDFMCLKIDCTGCVDNVLQDFYVRVGCH